MNSETPDSLKPYIYHGVNLSWNHGDEDATGDCPWCGREGKFSVNVATTKWRCFVCNEGTEREATIRGGNSTVFLRKLWELSYKATKPEDYQALATSRRL